MSKPGRSAFRRAGTRSGPQQYVDRSSPAVDGLGGGECHDVQMPAQPEVYRSLENRSARAGAIALAMHHSHAAAPGIAAVRDEVRELIARLRLSESVKIKLILARDQAAAQAAHHLIADAGALKRQGCCGVLAGGRGDQWHGRIEILNGVGGGVQRSNTRAARSFR